MAERGTPRFARACEAFRSLKISRLRRLLIFIAPLVVVLSVFGLARVTFAQSTPPESAPPVVPTAFGTPNDGPPLDAVTPLAMPPAPAGQTAAPTVVPAAPTEPAATPPAASAPLSSPAPVEAPLPAATPALGATPSPTPPPIIVEPPSAGVVPGGTQVLRVESALGTIAVAVANPEVADATIDQDQRTLTVVGKTLGTTTLTVRDDRGQTRDVIVRVADIAGSIPDHITTRLTGDPATQAFIAERALAAAIAATQTRPGAQILATQESVKVTKPLSIDDVTTVDVPVIVQGDAYFTTEGTVHVRIENQAQPSTRPASLLVSDFPETLKENGRLFTADLTAARVERFLYYHYNPPGQPDRRIVLLAENDSDQPATVQFISGAGGPGPNEMSVGHDSTQKFLVRLLQNEGSVLVIPAHTTEPLLAQFLPAGSVVSNLLQLHEISGAAVHLTLVAQNANDPVSGAMPQSVLLEGDVPHARGIYPIPEFFFEYRYDTQGPDLEMPIGQIPLPNLERGQTLSGDYGVLQSLTIRMVNYDAHNAAQVALYANPRGGTATGTFIIDRELVQAHAIPAFARFKLRQYVIPPRAYVETDVVTMPEGGSSYPLRLEIAPDDGSVPPGQVGSPVY